MSVYKVSALFLPSCLPCQPRVTLQVAVLLLQADIKEILPHTALLFAPPGSQVPPADPLVGAAAAPQWAGDAAPRPQSAGRPRPKPTKPTPQAEHAAAIASDLDSLASRAVEKLRYRGERELDRLASAFQYQPQLKILDREVQSRAVQVPCPVLPAIS